MAIDIREIELSDEQRRQLAQIAERTGKSWRDILRSALQALLAGSRRTAATKPESLYEALRQDGLIGCISGAPADLSTNPVHLEGFGTDESSSG